MLVLRLPLASFLVLVSSLGGQTPPDDLANRVEALSKELERVKEQLPKSDANTIIGGYGEISFNHFTKDSAKDTADLRRFVLGVTHRFDEDTELVTELEVEHAVASSDDKGEVEIEQAFIEHRIAPGWSLRGGLFLIPSGLLNEHHEPTAYYGVERNFVETAIIPSTWREGGIQIVGNFQNGLTLQTGISTGFDLSKWDATSEENIESPLGSVHQELSQAKSHSLAFFAALNWKGLPGLQLGGSVFSGNGGQGQKGTPSMGTTLWETHGRWSPGRFDFSAVYAQGSIRDTASFNQSRVGNPYLVPKRFEGWYGQAACNLWSSARRSLASFIRFESFNTASAFETLNPVSLTPAGAATEKVWTVGFNFDLNSHVVVKADLRRFRENTDQNRMNIGLGWSF